MNIFFGKDRPGRGEPRSVGDYVAPEILGAFSALKRSSEIARQIAFLTGTDVILMRDERVMREAGSESVEPARERGRPGPGAGNVRPLNRPVR